AAAPAQFLVGDAAKRIEHGVEVGRNQQAEMFEIVAGVDHDRQVGAEHPGQTRRQLGAADTAAQGDDPAAAGNRLLFQIGLHRNMSLSRLRISDDASRLGATTLRPRTRTAGSPSAAWPISKDAAEASSSATA